MTMDISNQLHRVETLMNTLLILEGQYNDPECDIEDKCIDLFTNLVTIKERMAELRRMLRGILEQIKIEETKIQELKMLNAHIDHIRNQLPEENENVFEPKRLVMDVNDTANQNETSPVPKSWAQLMSPSPCLTNSSAASAQPVSLRSKVEDNLPCISYVTEAEINAVPKYMKGRCTAVSINKLIESLNMAFKRKYETLAKPKKSIKQKDLEYYYEWKRTENLEPKGTHFITVKDANTFGIMKIDKACFNMITILRHLKRLKETRHANNQVHYVKI